MRRNCHTLASGTSTLQKIHEWWLRIIKLLLYSVQSEILLFAGITRLPGRKWAWMNFRSSENMVDPHLILSIISSFRVTHHHGYTLVIVYRTASTLYAHHSQEECNKVLHVKCVEIFMAILLFASSVPFRNGVRTIFVDLPMWGLTVALDDRAIWWSFLYSFFGFSINCYAAVYTR